MANSITAFSPTYWSASMGNKLYKKNVYRSIASFKEEATLRNGQKVDRPYRANVVIEDYTKGTALTAQDLTATSDQLTVGTIKAMLLYVDDIDAIQNKYSAANAWIEEASERLANGIDAKFFYEVINAADTIDDGDLGGTNGNGFTVTTSNIQNVFAKINRKLDVNNVPRGANNRFLVVSPQFFDVLWQYIAGKNTMLGDNTGKNGELGEWGGLRLFMSNNLLGSAEWVPANNPSNNDTVTINGVVFTFKTTIGTTAGNILIGASTAATITNLVAIINLGGVTSDAGVSNVTLSTANQRTVQQWVAVDGTTKITVRAMGASYMTVTGSDATDVWTAAQQLQRLMAGKFKSVDLVIQKQPTVKMASTVSAGKIGTNILPFTLFGVKTFNQGTLEMFDVQVRSDAY